MNGLTRSSGREQRATNDPLPKAFSFEGAGGLRPGNEMVPPSSRSSHSRYTSQETPSQCLELYFLCDSNPSGTGGKDDPSRLACVTL